MDAHAEKAELAMAYGQTYPTCTETGGLMPVRASSTHLKVPLLIAIPARGQRRRFIVDEEAQQLLLAEYKPFTQWAAAFLVSVGLLVCSAVVYLALLASVPAPPQGPDVA